MTATSVPFLTAGHIQHLTEAGLETLTTEKYAIFKIYPVLQEPYFFQTQEPKKKYCVFNLCGKNAAPESLYLNHHPVTQLIIISSIFH